jgi:hypothetical protein
MFKQDSPYAIGFTCGGTAQSVSKQKCQQQGLFNIKQNNYRFPASNMLTNQQQLAFHAL